MWTWHTRTWVAHGAIYTANHIGIGWLAVVVVLIGVAIVMSLTRD